MLRACFRLLVFAGSSVVGLGFLGFACSFSFWPSSRLARRSGSLFSVGIFRDPRAFRCSGGILFHVKRCFHVSLGSRFLVSGGIGKVPIFRVDFVVLGVIVSR